MSHQDTLLGLLPPVSYNRTGQAIRDDMQVKGKTLDRIRASGISVGNAIDPRTANNWLVNWERVLGLDGTGNLQQQRVRDVVAKINETGGLSIPYFINLAKAMGYEITIDEPQPFRAGINRAGDRLAPDDIRWVWQVNVKSNSQNVFYFRAGLSAAGDRLSAYADPIIESVFQDLKPAFTFVRFTYQG